MNLPSFKNVKSAGFNGLPGTFLCNAMPSVFLYGWYLSVHWMMGFSHPYVRWVLLPPYTSLGINLISKITITFHLMKNYACHPRHTFWKICKWNIRSTRKLLSEVISVKTWFIHFKVRLGEFFFLMFCLATSGFHNHRVSL